MTSHQKSDSVNPCEFTWKTTVSNFTPIPFETRSILREHRPLPNASTKELWQFFRIRIVIQNGLPDPDSDVDRHQNVISWSPGHTQALRKISSKSVGNSIIQRIRISDFGLLNPEGDPDRHQNWTYWSLGHALPLQEISSKSVHNFFSYPTDRQTDRQTNRPKWKHNVLRRRLRRSIGLFRERRPTTPTRRRRVAIWNQFLIHNKFVNLFTNLSSSSVFESYRAHVEATSNRWDRHLTRHIGTAADAERYAPRWKDCRFLSVPHRPCRYLTAWRRRHLAVATYHSPTTPSPAAAVAAASPDIDGGPGKSGLHFGDAVCAHSGPVRYSHTRWQRRCWPEGDSNALRMRPGNGKPWRHRNNQYITVRLRTLVELSVITRPTNATYWLSVSSHTARKSRAAEPPILRSFTITLQY